MEFSVVFTYLYNYCFCATDVATDRARPTELKKKWDKTKVLPCSDKHFFSQEDHKNKMR